MNKVGIKEISFTSLNHPIKPFKLPTNYGNINFNEYDYKQTINNKGLEEIASFFLDNFAYTSAHPFWKKCQKTNTEFNNKTYNDYIQELIKGYILKLKNPDTTLLLGYNKDKKLCAGLLTTPLNLSKYIKNNNTLYIDNLAVDKTYRNNNIAKQLLEKVINSSNGRYKNSFLIAYNESVPFYLKQNYKIINDKILSKNFFKSIKELRIDYPQYCTLMGKFLNILG